MTKITDDILHRTLENRASKGEAQSAAEWLGNKDGLKWADKHISICLESDDELLRAGDTNLNSEGLYRRIASKLKSIRRRQIILRVAAALIPFAMILGGGVYLNRQVDGLFNKGEQLEFSVERGYRTHCLFQDGSTAHLNAESKISYPKKFGLFDRVVQLQGEAYFNIEGNPQRPFIIELGGAKIEVLGTSFNVKAYPDESNVYVTLDKGSLLFSDHRGDINMTLSPQQQLIYNRQEGVVRLLQDDNMERYSMWKDDVITFKDTPLNEALHTLSRWYDVDFDTDKMPPSEILYTFSTSATNLDGILKEIELITPDVRFERIDDRLIDVTF